LPFRLPTFLSTFLHMCVLRVWECIWGLKPDVFVCLPSLLFNRRGKSVTWLLTWRSQKKSRKNQGFVC
jgi:hypothetical protein